MKEQEKRNNRDFSRSGFQRFITVSFFILLLAGIAAEIYLILIVRERIDKKMQETETSVLELQHKKNERTQLYEKLKSTKTATGDAQDEQSP